VVIFQQYTNTLGYKISKLGIGAAQFGYNYGINNKIGQPSKSDLNFILTEANKEGINLIDTAYEYGNSESIIGDILSKNNIQMIICTKLKVIEKTNINEILKDVRSSINDSLKRLKINSIPIFFLHRPEYMKIYNGCILKELIKSKNDGKLQHIGVSVYTPEEANDAFENDIESILIPFNIFDHRFIRNNIFDKAKERDIAIFVRSVYFQGLIPMEISEVPKNLESIIPYKKKLEILSNNFNMTPSELALKFVLSYNEINSVIIGIEKYDQLQKNIKIWKSQSFSDSIIDEILNEFNNDSIYYKSKKIND